MAKRGHIPNRRRSRQAGFTLLEMMVALVAGAIAIASIYYVSAASSQHFHEQQRVAQAQMSLRMAMEQIRRDVQRAGYLGTPNSSREQTCYTSAGQVQAVELLDDADGSVVDPDGANLVEADRLRLTGNYTTSDSYLAIGLGAGGNTIYLQRNWQSFRRTFGATDTGDYSEEAFSDVFRTDSYLHIETRQGNHFFVRITGATPAQAAIQFTPSLPVGGHCVVGLADGATVSPLSRVEYAVVDPSVVGSNLVNAASGAIGANGPVLMRQEIEIDGTTPIANTQRVVAENVADFDVDFVVDTAITAGAPPSLRLDDDAAAQATLAPGANPHWARAAVVRLSLRSSREDPRFPAVTRSAGDPLTAFDVDPTVPGAARVRTASTEILIPNVASRAIRP